MCVNMVPAARSAQLGEMLVDETLFHGALHTLERARGGVFCREQVVTSLLLVGTRVVG